MPEIQKFRKKPVVVDTVEFEAIQWTGENRTEVEAFIAPHDPSHGIKSGARHRTVSVPTSLGFGIALKGDWIAKYGPGDFRPIPNRTFTATYEEVTPDAQ